MKRQKRQSLISRAFRPSVARAELQAEPRILSLDQWGCHWKHRGKEEEQGEKGAWVMLFELGKKEKCNKFTGISQFCYSASIFNSVFQWDVKAPGCKVAARSSSARHMHAHAGTEATKNSEVQPRGTNTRKWNSIGKSWCRPNWKWIKFQSPLTKH